ncbi:MAG: hypothetical protein M0011_12375 [Elusimicrobia bacterium]|nr:hypothetical protein [Elusimicrobiota bacterium]
MKTGILAAIVMLAAFCGPARGGEVKINTTEMNGRYVDDFSNLTFVNDPAVLGKWVSVDFVGEPAEFMPGKRRFRGDLYLEGLSFLPNGKTAVPWFGWTRGVVMHLGGDHTAARYSIVEMGGEQYMFFEWKSGDYTIRHKKPKYYVLKKAVSGRAPGQPTLEREGRN